VLWAAALALAFKTLPCKMEMGCFVPSIQKHRQQVFNYYTLINTTNPPTMLARQRQGAHKQTGSFASASVGKFSVKPKPEQAVGLPLLHGRGVPGDSQNKRFQESNTTKPKHTKNNKAMLALRVV